MTSALLRIMHDLFKASDQPNIIIRVLFVDFSKAFNLIDHDVLASKFKNIGIPDHITAWSLDFPSGRKQFVKIGDNISNILSTHAGTPQGTLAGPNDFKLIINDLQIDIGYIKYADDTTRYSLLLIQMINRCTLQLINFLNGLNLMECLRMLIKQKKG
jgi:hypothetical protein